MLQNKYLPEGLLFGTAGNREYISSAQWLEKAMQSGKILEAPATLCDGEMNLHVDLGSVRGIIPREEVALCRDGEETKQIAIITRVGKPVCFKVLSVIEEGGVTTAVLSRRLAQLECKSRFISDLVAGDIIRAKVTHLESFGAFVDIGCGIASLLTVDCISVSRISHPKDRFVQGEYIPVIIKQIDSESGRIFVTHRELLGTWEENASAFLPAQTVSGIVRSIEEYGIFVELAPNLAGLAEYKAGVHVGDIAGVYIKSIIPSRMKIKLVIIDSCSCEEQPKKRKYYIDCENTEHIDSWIYSPLSCAKLIKTEF